MSQSAEWSNHLCECLHWQKDHPDDKHCGRNDSYGCRCACISYVEMDLS